MRRRTFRGLLLLALSTIGVAGSQAHAAVAVGMMDTFDQGILQGWTTGPNSPNPLAGIADGGPAGSGDGYLLATSHGGPGAGGRLVAFAGPQWLGDYASSAVTAIRMQANNLGTTELALRLAFLDASFSSAYTSDAVLLPAGSGWSTITFDVRPAALAGSPNVLNAVTEIRLYHNPEKQLFTSSPNVAASLGIDNVTAVPEPHHWVLFSAGIAILCVGARRSHKRSVD